MTVLFGLRFRLAKIRSGGFLPIVLPLGIIRVMKQKSGFMRHSFRGDSCEGALTGYLCNRMQRYLPQGKPGTIGIGSDGGSRKR